MNRSNEVFDPLLEMLRTGNSKGLDLLYDKYAAALFGTIVRWTSNEKVAYQILEKSFSQLANDCLKSDCTKFSLYIQLHSISLKIYRNEFQSVALDQNVMQMHKKIASAI